MGSLAARCYAAAAGVASVWALRLTERPAENLVRIATARQGYHLNVARRDGPEGGFARLDGTVLDVRIPLG